MRPFRYHRPASPDDALAALGTAGSVPLGGGTDLLVTMKEGLAEPEQLVDVRHLRGARDITVRPDGSVRFGGAVRIADIAAHAVIRERFAALAEAARMVGTPALRNMGTIAGNLCQRPRCWYFRPSAPSPAVLRLAIGASACRSIPSTMGLSSTRRTLTLDGMK